MPCPRCGSTAAGPSGRCSVCGATVRAEAPVDTAVLTPRPDPPSGGGDETRLADPDETHLTPPPLSSATRTGGTNTLSVGQNFGPRYHIIRCIGTGGMGAVYQAWDQELEVAVAVKVIRPDSIDDPAMAAELQRRFKRELVLARKVTHRNVVRIHDIGEIDGVKYITMPYVHGSDLATILKREGRLPLDRALLIGQQVVAGLVAAHEAGVVHRDLKPANIMVDADNHALIMDFGIARSTTNATGLAMTVAGAVIGTVDYMAPEQARGEEVDQRADVYAFGLILRDMLLGGRHAGHTTGVAELMARMQHAPAGPRSIDPTIPEAVDALVLRCLQPKPADRYQTSAELLADLERVSAGGEASSAPPAARRPWYRRLTPVQMGAATLALLVIVGLGAWAAAAFLGAGPGSTRVVTVGVLPFRNATGDPSLDSLGSNLSEVLATDLGEGRHISIVPPQRLQEVLGDLRIDQQSALSPTDLDRIAEFTNAGSMVWGNFTKFGDQIRIDATLRDQGQEPVSLSARAANETALLDAVADLAGQIQKQLAGGSSEVLRELQASAWRPTTQSIEALDAYNEGQRLAREGNLQGALKRYEAAIGADPNFALAHSGMARTYAGLGFEAEALQASRRAHSLGQALPDGQERYLIAAGHHRITNDTEQAVGTYQQLLAVAPNNAQLHYELAGLYEDTGDLERAAEHFAKVIELDPKSIAGLTAVGRISIKRGDPQQALEPLNQAIALAVQLGNEEGRATALQAIGIAYKLMGRLDAALENYRNSLEIKRRLGQEGGMAASLSEIAQIQETMGQPQEAVASYEEALALQRKIGDRSRMAITLINLGALLNETLGRPDDGLPYLREALDLARNSGDRWAEALALNNIGSAYFAKGQLSEAQTQFQLALQLRQETNVPSEIADTLHSLGETSNRMGRFDEALKRYMSAIDLRRKDNDRRMEAIESYSIGTVFDYQGRYGAAVQAKSDALAAYRETGLRDFWLGEILSGHGYSLVLSGQFDEAKESLDEALDIAKDLQNTNLTAQVLRIQSDRQHYRGDPASALKLAEEANRLAAGGSDRSLQLWTEAQLARARAVAQATPSAAATLAGIGQRADRAGAVYLSVLTALETAETLLRAGSSAEARRQAERTLARAETLGLRELAARAEFVVAEAMRLAGDGQARRRYATVLRSLDEMRREKGNGDLLERAYLKAIHTEAERWSQAS